MKVFLDANVLFSASLHGSPTFRLVQLAMERGSVVTSPCAGEEARRNVALKRPGQADTLAALMAQIQNVPDTQFLLPVSLAEKDRPILCAAIRGGCTHLATGDKRDFGHLYGETVQGVRIVSLLRLAEILTATESDAC